MKAILYYIHDPMCSWCWGFDPVLHQLVTKLPEQINIVRLLGGLAPDSHEPMPASMHVYIQQQWRIIEDKIPEIKFNFDFWQNNQPQRSTYPACRAILAAKSHAEENDLMMTRAIQEAYYLRALNPSNDEVLINLAVEIGLYKDKFKHYFYSSEISKKLISEIAFSRQLKVNGFPSLVLSYNDIIKPIRVDFLNYEVMLTEITGYLNNSKSL